MKLAAALAARPDLPALLSFAGRTKAPQLPSIPCRIGGFGGGSSGGGGAGGSW
jgi:precorrin-6A/cobalt-precorrin-6A reductase